jgi:hypothetical protein
MLCMECGAEMRLVEVAKANTMPVPGFEHRTWQCSGCSAVEQRMTFTREETPAKTEPIEPTRTGSVHAIQTALAGKVQAEPTDLPQAGQIAPPESVSVQLAQTAPTEAVQTKLAGPAQTDRAKATATVPVKSTQTATVEPAQTIRQTHPEPPSAMAQIDARAKALEEKVRNLKERVTAARKVAGDTKRVAQFDRNWDNEFRSAPSPSGPSNTSSHIKPDEPLLSPTEPISDDKPVAPVSNTLTPPKLRKTLGGLVRAIAPKGFSKVR